MVSAGASKSNIAGNDAKEFPDMVSPDGDVVCRVKGKDILRMLAETGFVVDQTAVGVINGCKLSLQGSELSMLTKSNTRMSLAKSTVDGEGAGSWVISERAMGQLKKLAEDADELEILQNQSAIFFRAGDRLMYVRLLSVMFPDLSRIMSVVMPHEIRANKKELRAALDRVIPFSQNQKTSAINVTVSGQTMKLTAENHDVGDAEETVAVDYSGPDVSARYNPTYILQPLSVVTGDTVILAHSKEHAGNFRIGGEGDTFTYICAGMRG